MKKDLREEFTEFAKEEFGYDITFEESENTDTFERLFGYSFIAQKEDSKDKL